MAEKVAGAIINNYIMKGKPSAHAQLLAHGACMAGCLGHNYYGHGYGCNYYISL